MYYALQRQLGYVCPLVFRDGDPKISNMTTPLQTEFDYYIAHQAELVEKYNGKVVVLKGHEIIGVFADKITAMTEAQKTHALGTFLVQKVEPGTGAYTQSFHSRVAFTSQNAGSIE
jgi:hypothetical protein